MKILLKKLSDSELKLLSRHKEWITSDGDELIKKDEIPQQAYVVLDGEVRILKRGEDFLSVGPGYVMGLKEMLQHLPCKLHCRARHLKAIVLGREDLRDDSVVFPCLKSLITS